MVTAGVAAMGPGFGVRTLMAVKTFSAFDNANDPHREHDFGALDIDGHKNPFSRSTCIRRLVSSPFIWALHTTSHSCHKPLSEVRANSYEAGVNAYPFPSLATVPTLGRSQWVPVTNSLSATARSKILLRVSTAITGS